LSSGSDGVSEIVKAASTASKEVQEKTREELADIKEKLARDSGKLKEEFAVKAEKERSILEKRLKGRHEKRINELMDQVLILANCSEISKAYLPHCFTASQERS